MADRNDEEILRAILEKGSDKAKQQAAAAIAQQPPTPADPPVVKQQKKKRKGLSKVAGALGKQKFYYGPGGTIVDKEGAPAPETIARMLRSKDEMADRVREAVPKATASPARVGAVNSELRKIISGTSAIARSHDQVLQKMPELFGQIDLAMKNLIDKHHLIVEQLVKQNEELQDKVIEALTGARAPTRAGGAVSKPKRGSAARAVGASRAAGRRPKLRETNLKAVMERRERILQAREDRNRNAVKKMAIAGAVGGLAAGAAYRAISGGGAGGGGGAAPTPGPAAPGPTGTEPSPGAQRSSVPGMVELTTPISKKKFVVAEQYANNFKGFVDELENSGYTIKSIGGYANRNIAGTGQKSFHSLGVAIDINPSTNPHVFPPKGLVTDMPSNVAQMAAKYGLGWGGNWRSSKDAMHFSMASAEGGSVGIDRSGVAPLPGAPAAPAPAAGAAAGAPGAMAPAAPAPAPPPGVPARAMAPSPGTPGAGAAQGDVVKVVESGAGYNVVQLADGSVEKRTGARNWRNNNPGNITYGAFAQRYGAIGTDGRFAIFPTYEHGRRAKEALLFESQGYAGMNVAQAISRYAPPNENNTQNYIATVAAAAGVSPSTPLSQLTAQQRTAMLASMEKVEGFRSGRTAKISGPTGVTTAAAAPTAPGAAPAQAGVPAAAGPTPPPDVGAAPPGVAPGAMAPSPGTPNAPAPPTGERPSNLQVGSAADLSKVDPDLLKRLYAAVKEYGQPVRINSAYRGDDYQAQLWVRANVYREPGIYSPARPAQTVTITYKGKQHTVQGSGRGSSHGRGQAVDVSPGPALDPFLRKYGLHRPHASFDPPHVEKMGGSSYQAPSSPGAPAGAPSAPTAVAQGRTMAEGSARQAMAENSRPQGPQLVVMNNNRTMMHTKTVHRGGSLQNMQRPNAGEFNPFDVAATVATGFALGKAMRLF